MDGVSSVVADEAVVRAVVIDGLLFLPGAVVVVVSEALLLEAILALVVGQVAPAFAVSGGVLVRLRGVEGAGDGGSEECN